MVFEMPGERIPWDEIDSELLDRYASPAPRYTSYPTAPEWRAEFGPDQYRAALAAADERAGEPLSLYVHVPYCQEKCLFCGCASWLATGEDDFDRYLDGVAREVEAVASCLPRRRGVSQFHWGGGTPTTLDPPRLERLFKLLTGPFELTDDAEVAIEVNPVVTTLEQLDTLAGLGFNRLSRMEATRNTFAPAESGRSWRSSGNATRASMRPNLGTRGF